MKPTTSRIIGYFAAGHKEGVRAQEIVNMVTDLKITGAARQATADAALLHLVRYQTSERK